MSGKKNPLCGVNNFKSFLFLKLNYVINWAAQKPVACKGPDLDNYIWARLSLGLFDPVWKKPKPDMD